MPEDNKPTESEPTPLQPDLSPVESTALKGLEQANEVINEFSSYGDTLGAAGVHDTASNAATDDALGNPGDCIAISPPSHGLGDMYVGCAWNAVKRPAKSAWGKFFGTTELRKIDIDLGCMYEMEDGTKGALQALGEDKGGYDHAPFIQLSGDERTGLSDGDDEFLRINGAEWPKVKRVLIYAYIYHGARDWSFVKPQMVLRVPGEQPFHVRPRMSKQNLPVCAIAILEQIRGGIKLTNLTEFFPGQPEMDRAYGFGLNWADGEK